MQAQRSQRILRENKNEIECVKKRLRLEQDQQADAMNATSARIHTAHATLLSELKTSLDERDAMQSTMAKLEAQAAARDIEVPW